MRKVALLLASLGIMAAAYAEEPKLVVTNVGQEIEIENTNGNEDFDQVNLFNNVGLKYGDWSFGLQAGKQWSIDGSEIHSSKYNSAGRLQLDVWKKINDDLKLGARFRGTTDYDRWYARWDWKHGMLWSAGDIWYQAENKSDNGKVKDSLQFEVFPIGVQYGPVKVGYFLNYVENLGTINETEKEDYIEHQIRAYATLYKGEKLTVTTEGRFTLCADDSYKGTEPDYRHYDDFGRTRIYLGADYKVNESLNVYAKYAYEFRDWKYENEDHRSNYATKGGENYQDIIVGWNYKF